MSDNDKPQVINPPDMLKGKVSVGGPGAVDPSVLERAEAVITNLADNYLEWVQEDFDKIIEAFDRLKNEPDNQEKNLDDVFQIGHDMKGQGGSFGYDLITIVGDKLCRFIEKLEGKAGASEIAAIQLHIDAMRVVISQRIEGDGGKLGDKLLGGIDLVHQKLQK